MAEAADRVVVELLARVDNFDRTVKQSASTFDQSMNKIAGSATKAEGAVRKTSLGVVQASTQMYKGFDDVGRLLVSDRSPFVVPVKQAPQVASAMRLVSAGAAALGGVMGGLLVTGALAAAAALAEFVFKSNDVNDVIEAMVKKLKDQAEKASQSREAQEQFNRTVEGAALIIAKMTDALNEQNRTLEHNIALNKAAAASSLGTTIAGIGSTANELAAARRRAQQAEAALAAAEAGAGAGDSTTAAGNALSARGERDRAVQRVRELTEKLRELTVTAEQGARALRSVDFPLIEQEAKEAVDPIAAINRKFDDMAKKAKLAGTYTRDLAKAIEAQRAAAIKAERDSNKKAKAPSLPPVTGSEVARALGTSINPNGGTRNAAQNKAAGGAANSYHLAGQAIDIPLTVNGKPLTKDGIRAALAPLGVEIKELLGPGDKGHNDHFHIAFSKKRLGADQVTARAERAADQAEREAAEARRNQEAYLDKVDRLNEQILSLKGQQAGTVEESLRLSLAQIEADRKSADRDVERELTEGRIDATKAAELRELNGIVENLQKRRVGEEAQLANMRRADEVSQRQIGYQIADLEFLDDMATSRVQHRDLQHQIVDLLFQQRIAHLQSLEAQARLAGETQKAADIQAEINRARVEQGQAHSRVDKQTQSPLGRMAEDAANIDDQLEQIAANGLADFVAGITDAITGAKSLEEAFSQMAQSIIKDLIAMIVKALIFKALQAALPGLFPASGHADGGPVKRALGGFIRGPGTSTSDSIPALLSDGEYVMRASAVKQLGVPFLNALNRGQVRARATGGEVRRVAPANLRAAGFGGGGVTVLQSFTLDARGGVVTEDLLRQVNTIATTRAAQAGQAAFDASQKAMPQRFARFSKLGS